MIAISFRFDIDAKRATVFFICFRFPQLVSAGQAGCGSSRKVRVPLILVDRE